MSQLERVVAAAPALKVFPLPSVVLFPGAAVPLHIFEPRYRQLLRDCLASDQVLALAQLAPGWEADYAGRPPMKPVACAGVVGWSERLDEGRYNIIIQGVVRIRILEEHEPREPYRVIRAEPLVE